MFERTVRKPVDIRGRGLHTGKEAEVRILPAGPGTGVIFARPGSESGTRAADAFGRAAERRTRVVAGGQAVETVEHLLSALSGLGVANARIEVRGPEIPALDGSAAGFARAVTRAGLVRQKRRREIFELKEPVFAAAKDAAILALPYDRFRVTYTLDYPHPRLRAKTVSFDVDEKTYLAEIAPARTFCTREEARALRARGFGLGADTQNTLVMGPKGPLRNRLRFADECARHKVLDLIGDLAPLGFAVEAHFIAVRSGHALNREIGRLILQQKERTS